MVPEEVQLNNKSQSMESKESKMALEVDSSDELQSMDSDDSNLALEQRDSPEESQSMENEEADESGSESEGCVEEGVTSGWADAMKKILSVKKPLKKKTIVLAKAKRLSIMKIKQDAEEEATKKHPAVVPPEKKKEWTSRGREKPNVLQKDKEKALAKTATRGIVQLFNAVKDHKKSSTVKEENESLRKKLQLAELNKKQFLNMLRGEHKTEIKDEVESEDESDPEVKEEDISKWEVLKDNFLTSVKLKNWDQTDNNAN